MSEEIQADTRYELTLKAHATQLDAVSDHLAVVRLQLNAMQIALIQALVDDMRTNIERLALFLNSERTAETTVH